MTWSYSRISSFCQCPYEFYLRYIENNKSEENFFGQYGSFIHKILEKYAKGELSIFELSKYYEDNFDLEITCDAPYSMGDLRQAYFEKGLDYLDNIDLILDEYEVLGVEKKVSFSIDGYSFIGFIDLLLKDKTSGKILIIDHKSRALKFKKNGELSKTDSPAFEGFKRQLYLYSKGIIDEYKIAPSKLCWNMFKERKWISTDFHQDEYEQALQWAKWTIDMIKLEDEWKPNPEFYYCKYLCGMRNQACEYKM